MLKGTILEGKDFCYINVQGGPGKIFLYKVLTRNIVMKTRCEGYKDGGKFCSVHEYWEQWERELNVVKV